MSTQHHEEVEPATEPDHATTKFVFAWGIALGIGFFGSNAVHAGASLIGLCLVMGLTVLLLGAIGKDAPMGLAAGAGLAGLGLVFALLAGTYIPVNGPVSFGLGVAGVIGLGLTLMRALTGTLNRGSILMLLVLTALLPFALNGLRAFETMGVVGL